MSSLKRFRTDTPFELPATTKPEYREYFQAIESLKNKLEFAQALDQSQELVDKMNKDKDIDIDNYPIHFDNIVQEILYKNSHPDYNDEKPEQPLVEALYSLGALLIECNYANEAVKYLKRAYELAPYSPVIGLEYVEGLKTIGDYEEAKKVVKALLPVTYELEHIAHLIRDLGFIAIEEKEYENAVLFYLLSLKYQDSPVARQEIDYINHITQDLDAFNETEMEKFQKHIEQEGYNLSPIIDIVQIINDYEEKMKAEGTKVDINKDFYVQIFQYMQKINTAVDQAE